MSEAKTKRRPTPEFTISFAGGELPAEAVDRIHSPAPRVLQEIADLDLAATQAIRFINIDKPPNGGPTQGIWAEIEPSRLGPNMTSARAAADGPPWTCPSGRCEEDAVLLGIVSPDGTLAYLTPQVRVDKLFVDRARQGRTPEARFRFAQPCVEGGCRNWVADRCDVIEQAVESSKLPRAAIENTPLPICSIRRSCRWFAQRGAEACTVCPVVVHAPDG